MSIGLHVKYPLFLSEFNEKCKFSCQKFEKKLSNTKFHENLSSESPVVPCGRAHRRTDGRTDRETDMTELIVAFRSSSNAPKMCWRFGVFGVITAC